MKIKRLTDTAIIPIYSTEGSAGLDLYADETVVLEPVSLNKIKTGVAVQIPDGYVGIIKSRSSLSAQGLNVTGGVIDSDYRGEIIVLMENMTTTSYGVMKGNRVAQLILLPYLKTNIMEVENLDETERSEGGFGSTGR